MNILMVSEHDGRAACGVFDHASHLAAQLRSRGHQASLVRPGELERITGAWDLVHLHYVPFLFSGWGWGAVRLARRLRRLAPLVVTVHEPRIRYRPSPRGLLLAPAQDAFLQALSRLADRVIVPTARWLPFLRWRGAVVVPAGSTLPPASGPRQLIEPRSDRAPLRIGLIASGHHGRMHALAVSAARAVEAELEAEVVGIGEDVGDGLGYTGYLAPPSFADALASCDLLLLPYADGISGRRTSLISALQVGLPILTTMEPPMTDFPFDDALEYTAPTDSAGFIRRAVELAGRGERRARLAAAARRLFEAELAWPVIGNRIEAAYR